MYLQYWYLFIHNIILLKSYVTYINCYLIESLEILK